MSHNPYMMKNTQKQKTLWILKDNKLGSVHILDGISYFMDFEIKHIEIKYSKWAKLPNFILKFLPHLGITKESWGEISKNFPDLVLSAGRRTANVARLIKKKNPKTYVVQVLNPDMNITNFDLVIMPNHDGKKLSGSNVIYLDVLPHWISPQNVEKQKKVFEDRVKKLKPPYISVIIGGSTKTTQFSESMAKEFADKLNEMAKNLKGSLLILDSRRTGEKQSKIIENNLKVPYLFCHNTDSDARSAVPAFLGFADYIAITGESISMLTEATFARKPIFVYDNSALLAPKHKRFLDGFYKLGIARSMDEKLEKFKATTLENPGKKVAEIIKQKMGIK